MGKKKGSTGVMTFIVCVWGGPEGKKGPLLNLGVSVPQLHERE